MLRKRSETYYHLLLIIGFILIGLTGHCAEGGTEDSLFCYHCEPGICHAGYTIISCSTYDVCFKTLVHQVTVVNGASNTKTTVVRGCHDNRNNNLTVGICRTVPSPYHGDNSILTTKLCLCNTNYCNGIARLVHVGLSIPLFSFFFAALF